MGLFKDDDISGADSFNLDESALEGFASDDNIDKDLLNQIFADDSSASSDDGDEQLDIDSADFYIDEDKEAGKDLLQGTEDTAAGITEPEKIKKKEEIKKKETETVQAEAEKTTVPETVKEEAAEEPEAVQEKTDKTENVQKEKEDGMKDKAAIENKEKENTIVKEPEKETASKSIVPASVNDDIVNDEAMKSMNEERLNGTVTVITEKTTITGSISSDGSLEVRGTITGDIECAGKVYINGIVSGGVAASEIYVNTPKLNGGLMSEGTVKIGVGTVVLGDVTGSSAYIAGAVRGNIDIDGPVVIESTAILKGDIKARSITINSGAVIEGYCSLYNTGIDLGTFFEG